MENKLDWLKKKQNKKLLNNIVPIKYYFDAIQTMRYPNQQTMFLKMFLRIFKKYF